MDHHGCAPCAGTTTRTRRLCTRRQTLSLLLRFAVFFSKQVSKQRGPGVSEVDLHSLWRLRRPWQQSGALLSPSEPHWLARLRNCSACAGAAGHCGRSALRGNSIEMSLSSPIFLAACRKWSTEHASAVLHGSAPRYHPWNSCL